MRRLTSWTFTTERLGKRAKSRAALPQARALKWSNESETTIATMRNYISEFPPTGDARGETGECVIHPARLVRAGEFVDALRRLDQRLRRD